jgi:hypothetical protein
VPQATVRIVSAIGKGRMFKALETISPFYFNSEPSKQLHSSSTKSHEVCACSATGFSYFQIYRIYEVAVLIYRFSNAAES